MKPNVLLIILPYLQLSDDSKTGYWGPKYARKNVPSTKMKSWPALPYGCLSVATYSKDVANIKVMDCNVHDDYRTAIRVEVGLLHPDIVGFGMTFDNSYTHLRGIIEDIRHEDDGVITVIGGAATMPVYEDILREQEYIDAVCFGDGEIPFRELCESKYKWTLLSTHQSWVTRDSLKRGVAPVKTVVPNLDDTIKIDYSFINPSDYSMREEFSPYAEEMKVQKRFFIVTSRNCPWRCSFCYRSMSNDPNDRKMRFASVDKVINHVQYLIEYYGMTVLTINDDQFLVNMKRAKEILRRLAPFKIRIEILQGESVAFIDDEMARLMYEAGMRRVVLPIESGCREVLDRMVEKPVDLDKAKETIKVLRKHGLWVTAVFVMGFPGETDEQRQETLRWIQGADLDWCTFSAAVPIRGTKLYKICIEGGYIKNDIKLGELDFSNYFIHTPGYEPEYVAREIYKMNLRINFVENRAMRIGDWETAAKCFRQVIGMYKGHAFAWYYLADCSLKMEKINTWSAAWLTFRGIIDSDPKWKDYVREFGIGG